MPDEMPAKKAGRRAAVELFACKMPAKILRIDFAGIFKPRDHIPGITLPANFS